MRKSKSLYTISVTDSGIGLPKDLEDDLFDPYITSKQDGAGLGLAIVKQILEDHQGSLEIKNLENSKGVCASLKFKSNKKQNHE